MILKTLFAGVAGLGLVLLPIMAQPDYAHHHQQYLTIEKGVKLFDTKALTPVEEKEGPLKWAFVSTIKDRQDKVLKTLLVKLNANNETSNEFSFEWAKEYTSTKKGASMDVYDVFHVGGNKPKYILCGQTKSKRGSKKEKAFLVLVDEEGNFLKGKTYSEISVLKSVVRVHSDSKGYVAVGTRADRGKATFLRVDKDLRPICERSLHYSDATDATEFNKVIKYSGGGEKLFAVIGETGTNEEFGICKGDSNVVVALMNSSCDLVLNKQFGYDGSNDDNIVKYRGLSLAQWDEREGGLVITGHAYGYTSDCDRINFDDILVFQTDGNLDIGWKGRYGFNGDYFEIGTAIQMSNEKYSRVLVAGQHETLNSNSESTMDAFLLELNKKTGNVNNLDLFQSLSQDIDNGALFPGNLDLHITQDNNAFMVGNTKTGNNPDKPSKPFLIERYKETDDTCQHMRVEDLMKKDVELKSRFFSPDTSEVLTPSKKLQVTTKDLELTNEVVCEKKINNSNPTPSPPSPDVIDVPTIVVIPTVTNPAVIDVPTIGLPSVINPALLTPTDPAPVPEPPFERPEIPLGPFEPTPTIPVFLPPALLTPTDSTPVPEPPFERPEIPLGPFEPTPTIPVFLPPTVLTPAVGLPTVIEVPSIGQTPSILIQLPGTDEPPFGLVILGGESHKMEEELITPLDLDESGEFAAPDAGTP